VGTSERGQSCNVLAESVGYNDNQFLLFVSLNLHVQLAKRYTKNQRSTHHFLLPLMSFMLLRNVATERFGISFLVYATSIFYIHVKENNGTVTECGGNPVHHAFY